MAHHSDRYIRAPSHDWLTWLYDPLIRSLMHEAKFKHRLIEQAKIKDSDRMFREAGFEGVEETGQFMTRAGALPFYRALKQ